MKNKSYHSCLYAYKEIADVYGCINEKIIKSNIYRKVKLIGNEITDIFAQFYPELRNSNKNIINTDKTLEYALKQCKYCKYYKPIN